MKLIEKKGYEILFWTCASLCTDVTCSVFVLVASNDRQTFNISSPHGHLLYLVGNIRQVCRNLLVYSFINCMKILNVDCRL